MIRKIVANARKIIPNKFVNFGKHLPEAIIANIKYGFPGKKLKIIGVTGSDGKTTTVSMNYKILKDAGKKTSMISTICAVIGDKNYDTGFHVTNPSSFDLQRLLKESYLHGDEYVVLEVTSHGLDQFRVWGIPFKIGIITNITHEHLDYHKTFEKYRLAKAKLIENSEMAILNLDDPNFPFLKEKAKGSVITFGMEENADINPVKYSFKLVVPGDYNISNALAAVAASKQLGIDFSLIKKSLESFKGLAGRMEEIKNKKGITIVVDFAHTPNALKQALITLRTQTRNKLIAIFGCAGARDIKKRSMMGKISARLSNVTILTDEDPRFEDNYKIIDEVAQGAYLAGAKDGINLFKEPDRAKAIKLGIEMAKKGDIVGIFGKGHEKSMNYKGIEKLWSDQKAVISALGYAK